MIDIRIMAHPSRADNVNNIREALSLPESAVTWDDRTEGGDAMYTARKAWTEKIPEGCTHRIVFQDDAEVCDGFLAIAEKAAAKHPDSVVTFFHMGELPPEPRYQEHMLSVGVALMLPVKLIKPWFDYVDNDMIRNCTAAVYDGFRKADTSSLRSFLLAKHIRCFTTVPTLVQHIGDTSLVGIDRQRTAVDYSKTPPMDGW